MTIYFGSIQHLHHMLFDQMSDGVLVLNPDGDIVDSNATISRLLGYSKSELHCQSLKTLVIPEFRQLIPERMKLIQSQGSGTFESAYYGKDGSIIPVEISTRLIHINNNTVFLSIIRDITERKRLQAQLLEGVEVYQAAINTPALGFWTVDNQGKFLEANDAALKQVGYQREEMLQLSIPDIEANESPEETAARIEEIMRSGYARFRSRHRRKDGSLFPVEVVTTYSPVQGGCFFVFIEDVTEKNQQECQMKMAALVFESMDQAVVITDAENRIININPATTLITGYTLDELKGKDPRVFASGRHDTDFYRAMWQALEYEGHWEGEIWDRRKDGTIYPKWLTINVIRDVQGAISHHVSVFSDITERKKSEELIWRQANFDTLTGLPNRHLLHERLTQELKKAQRNNSPLALLFIDLDRFKEVNDTLGHAKGDALLVEAARRLRSYLRETDTIARLGGDEFTVVLPNYGNRLALEQIVIGVIQQLSQPYELGDGDLGYISASIGVTLYPDDATSIDDLLKHADQAMYAAKDEGRNRHSYFTASMQQAVKQKISLTNELRQAIHKQQLHLYYQPIIELGSGHITKAEALLRWDHPQRGLVSPDIFIPLAEDSGLIHEIGDWVFREACQSIKRWQQQYGHTIQVSINKSPQQFEREIEPSWATRLQELGLPGNCITVEITEGSLLSKSKRIKEQLIEFRNVGIEVSIDDFGTGFSALSYLHRFDIDYLKIDRSFIMDIEENHAHMALTEAIIVMAHKLGIKTIAEGVEKGEQLDMLKSFGCDFAQGYLISRPIPEDEFNKLFEESQQAHL